MPDQKYTVWRCQLPQNVWEEVTSRTTKNEADAFAELGNKTAEEYRTDVVFHVAPEGERPPADKTAA